MKIGSINSTVLGCAILCALGAGLAAHSQSVDALDSQVKQFLDNRRSSWRDLNISAADGQVMFDIIVKNKYRNALEIGTSTGHSGTWIAWALSKTGGKLITIDIDPDRHRQALENFKAAGLAHLIDARLGNAHEIVPSLPGPFDFVFSDADKDWYINYAKAVLPKLTIGGCLLTHNVSERGWGYGGDYLNFLRGVRDLETSVREGMSISYKKSVK